MYINLECYWDLANFISLLFLFGGRQAGIPEN